MDDDEGMGVGVRMRQWMMMESVVAAVAVQLTAGLCRRDDECEYKC